MTVDVKLYFSSINKILGPVKLRESLDDYDHVTDSGILMQLLSDNGHSPDPEMLALIKADFVEQVRRHIETVGPFSAIDGAVRFFEDVRRSDGTQVAIATGGWRESALLKLASAGFDVNGIPLASSDDSPSRVEIMRTALEMIGDEFESITYFGDALWDERACSILDWDFVPVGPDLDGIKSYKDI